MSLGERVHPAPSRDGRSDVRVHGLLVHAVSAGLQDRRADCLWIPDEVADQVVNEAARHRLTGFVMDAVHRGALDASLPTLAGLEDAHRQATMRVLLLERVLLSIVDVLDEAGIATRVLKGPAIARTLYADPSIRTFLDVDLLVSADDLDAAVSVLTGAGLRRMLPQLRSGFDRRFAKTVTFLHRSGCQVDLHRTLVIGPYGLLVDRRDLFIEAQTFAVSGRRVLALGPTAQFLNLCYHAALGDVPARLAPLRDVGQSLCDPTLEFEAALAMATRWHGRAVVARAVNLASSVLGLPPSGVVAWARSYRPGRRERRRLACYTSRYRSNSRKYLATAAVIPGLADKAAYLRALLFPAPAFVADRARDPARWWAHGLTGLLARDRSPARQRSVGW